MKKLTSSLLLTAILFLGTIASADPFVVEIPWTPDSTSLAAVLFNSLHEYDFLLTRETERLVQVNGNGNTIILNDGASRIECNLWSRGAKVSVQYSLSLSLDLDSLKRSKPIVTMASLLYRAFEQYLSDSRNARNDVLTNAGETIFLKTPEFSAALSLKGRQVTLTSLPTSVMATLLDRDFRKAMFGAFEEAGLSTPVLDSVQQESPQRFLFSFIEENPNINTDNAVAIDVNVKNLKVEVLDVTIMSAAHALEKGVIQPVDDIMGIDSDVVSPLLNEDFRARGLGKGLQDSILRLKGALTEAECVEISRVFSNRYVREVEKLRMEPHFTFEEAFRNTARSLQWEDRLTEKMLNQEGFLRSLRNLRGERLSTPQVMRLVFRHLKDVK
ncbi:MAG: hypothetical protein A2Z91_04205 [Deltaproteobacteria bacterium GWA2_38_16]|nr:MAG: hypothetical protein A2Z91_04205 [Deltaproteobacteria bacterium GWA2_38_16]OGQ01792.1 MAG: hypothetical protein A3D19_07975 [Deltaproteobacteria bacterium RIFCSPHIGHO2_02_FULL_38_15]OGQ30247.1 MAG: hypothetical protein A3A72_08345 [Deltaproteobacteria bacterium RIFCSPLOWO2_01_FULL_38_9]OGQ58892.1 MAG: hypothetical protein A3G92_07795 [Deltaproteobacteria bacterium RIFCSPLOWO2_12_FULL_38_8]HBQ21400.1 hypothetical protein [Deltaproteobacteria bacterium]